MSERRDRVPLSFAGVTMLVATLGCGGSGIRNDDLNVRDGGATDASEADSSETDAGDSSPLPAARGGSHFAPTTGGCNVATGFPIPPDGQPVNEVNAGSRVEDGVAGASVDCRVVTSADGFAFDGNVQVESRAFTIIANVAFAEEGGYVGTGTVWHTDPDSPALRSEDGACAVTVLPEQDIAPGRVWGNFLCETVSADVPPGTACSARGSFAFENCVQ